MSVDVFCCGEHRDVRAEFERALQGRREESVIHSEQKAMSLCDIRDRGNVSKGENRIRGRLDENDASLRRDRSFHVCGIRGIDECGVYSEWLQYLAEEADSSAVGYLGKDGVLACFQHGEKQCALGGHAAAEADRGRGSFQ